MNKQRKTSHILNVFQYDADGHVILPASLTLSIAPASGDNNSKVPTTAWVRAFVSGLNYVTGNQSITVSGDATGSGTTSIELTLANTAVTPGVYGSSTLVPVVTVDSKGRITNVSTASISGALTFTGDVTGTGTTGSSTGLTLANSGVTAGTYTKVTVDSKGRVTVGASATTTDIAEGTNLYYTDARVGSYLTANNYATQSYVGTQIANLVDAAPGTLDTLNELAAALGDDPNFATTIATSIGTKQAQLNGTGFVKVSGTTVSYDNSTYLTTSSAASTYVSLSGSYANPAWITSLGWGKITSTPTTISGYGITNAYTDAQIQNFFNGANAITGYNKSNWDTAYGWGNHASGGYLTTASAASTYVSLTGSYANPSWITSLAYSKITGVPAFLTSYTETDTLATVTGRGATTSTALSLSGKVTFSSAVANRPQMPGGILGLDTGDGNFDIWGISRDYYPSHATAANSWGLRWNGDNNDFEFVGGGTSRVILDMDGGNITATGTLSASGYNKTNWDTAYGWGNHASAGYITSSGSITGDAGSVGGISASRIVYGENSTATIGISNSTLDGALKSGFYTVGTGGIPNATSVNFVLHTAYNGVGNLAGFDLACNDSTTSQFYLRPATGGGKGAWQTIVTNSGTWSISITGNAATLGGYGPNQTGGANTIVQRDSNGYIQNSYFYTSGGGSERGTGISYIAGFNSSDYYIRSYTLQGLASAMSGATMNINGSATSATNSSYTTYMSTQFLGTGSMNVSTGSCASYRNENGAGGAVTYSPLLHMAASDTMWQLQGTYGTSGNGTLYFRQGYAGSWGNWLTMLSSSNYSSYAVPTTRSITINGTSYDLSSDRSWNISTSTAWSSISAGIRENYDLQFRPADNSSSYAGLSFASPGNSQNAGYFLVRGGADSDVYTQNGLTIVADLGWLTLAQRTTAGKGVRILTGTSATTRLQVTDSETWISTYSNYKIQFAGGDQINAYNGGSAATLYLNYIGGSGGAINMAAGRFTLDTSGNGIASGSLRAPIFYDSNDTGYFLDPTASGVSLRIAGSVFSDGSFATNGYGSGGNAAVGRVYGPDGAAYSYSGGGITGAIKIRLPIRNNDTMWSMKVRIYNYSTNQTSEYLLGNYAYNQGAWNYSATYLGGVNSSALTVRFGNEGGYDCVWIGETSTSWSYPVVSVMDFMGGYSNGSVSNWYSNWDISIVSSFGTVGASVAPNINFNEVYSYSYRGNSNVAGTGSASYHPSGIYSTGTNWLYGTMYLNGNTVYDANEIHANIFYDRNDTSYYLDPNSTSRLHSLITHYTRNIHDVATDHPFGLYFSNSFSDYSYAIYRQSGAWSHPYPDLHIAFHTGIKIGAYYGYNGTRFYNNSDWATITASVNDGDNNFRGYYDIIAYASDKRLKHNIQVIDNAIDKVMKLTGMTYQWNTIGSKHGWTPDTETREAGVFAQEVQEVLPEAVKLAPFDNNMGVSKSGENFLTVKYEKIVPLLIEAIKEQQKQIEELQNKLDNVLSSR